MVAVRRWEMTQICKGRTGGKHSNNRLRPDLVQIKEHCLEKVKITVFKSDKASNLRRPSLWVRALRAKIFNQRWSTPLPQKDHLKVPLPQISTFRQPAPLHRENCHRQIRPFHGPFPAFSSISSAQHNLHPVPCFQYSSREWDTTLLS